MIKPANLKPIEIGYGDDKIIIFPRMISVAEEAELNERFTQIADSDHEKYQKEFEICRNALGEFSAEMPVKIVKEKGELRRAPLVEEAASATDALLRYFGERTIENERVVRDAYFMFKSQLAPDARFLPFSAQ